MDYGPNDDAVRDFIGSLPSLTSYEFDAGVRAALNYRPGFMQELDEASLVVVHTLAGNAVLDAAVTAAKPSLARALDSIAWLRGHDTERDVRLAALQALGALVVLDDNNFAAVLARFRPFRHSRVLLPVQWPQSPLA